MSGIQVIALEKQFSGTGNPALRNCTLKIESGRFLSITGPSGSGKSTLLRVLAGLIPPDRGEIIIDGDNITATPPENRRLSMVFQHFTLYPHMTVRKNISFGLKLRHYDKATIQRLIRETARIFDIEDLLELRPQALSSLQQQQVALARAISRQPKLLLLDDPMAELSESEKTVLRRQIIHIHRIFPCTIIFAASNPTEALSLADQVIVLNHGRIVQSGTPAEIYRTPIDLFTARFFGSPEINCFKMRLRRVEPGNGSPELQLIHSHFKLSLPFAWHHRLLSRIGYGLTVAVRAEDFEEVTAKSIDGYAIKTVIEMQEHQGNSMLLYLKTEKNNFDTPDDEPVHFIVRTYKPGRYRIGDPFYCTVSPEMLHLFDPVTGERIL